MTTIDDVINRKNGIKKKFKKISYKPWESSFLTLDNADEAIEIIENEGGVELNETNIVVDDFNNNQNDGLVTFDESAQSEIENLVNPYVVPEDIVLLQRTVKEVTKNEFDGKEINNHKTSINLHSSKKFHKQAVTGVSLKILKELMLHEDYKDDCYLYCLPIKTHDLSQTCDTSYRTVRTTIERLRKKSYLVKLEGKPGRGGYALYCLPLEVVKELS